MHTTSLSLLHRLTQPVREPAAWERFVHLYSPLLSAWALQVGLNEAEAADAVQDVLLLLLDNLSKFERREGCTFRSWLRTVLRNKSRDWQRRNQRSPKQLGSQSLQQLARDDDAELFSDAEYRGFIVREALKLMQTEFQTSTWQACWLTLADGLTAREAAARLGISENAVFVARSRVLGRLREEFADFLD